MTLVMDMMVIMDLRHHLVTKSKDLEEHPRKQGQIHSTQAKRLEIAFPHGGLGERG
jgi:hypothetical protein